jgi:UDP-N-acetylmuramoyl-L-alanyl-D-glutamate--2,6-diaminopimelate ligase
LQKITETPVVALTGDDLAASLIRPPAGIPLPALSGLCLDSRKAFPGCLFAAIPGTVSNGLEFAPEAIAQGAAAVLVPHRFELPNLSVPVLSSENVRRSVALLAARQYPQQPAILVAVTGTNGKSSTVDLCRQLWQQAGIPAASLGTLGVMTDGWSLPGSLTTPDPLTLHQTLQELTQRGVQHAALEASSHGLDQERLAGLRLTAAAFTNLTRDHLDYHKTEDSYFAAKARLFADILPAGGVAVLNHDSQRFEELAFFARTERQHILTFGSHDRADIRLVGLSPANHGQTLDLIIQGTPFTDVTLPLFGAFQAENLLAALGLLMGTGMTASKLMACIPHLVGVPGRLEVVTRAGHPFTVFVDYAHTPDALQNALRSLKPHTSGRLVVVFGCGGDRDRGKRPLMGQVAAALADHVIITDDNPRSEDPASIRTAVLAGCPAAQQIGDRRTAIYSAIGMAQAGDTILLAGKGHEQGQIIGQTVLPFADTAVAREALGVA